MSTRIPVAEPELGEGELRNIINAIKSGWISSKGSFINEFEQEFSKYIGVKHAIAVANGTAALHLALLALDTGPGDEVLIPDLTFISPASMTVLTGATPVFVDANPRYWCMDVEDVNRKITNKTKAMVIVHLYGHPADIDPLLEIAEEHDIYVIEDCAQAHGAEYKRKKVGSFGIISCFSFYANKIVTTGEGGICLTDDQKLAQKIRLLHDHGMGVERPYWHEILGFNYRMTNLQAAIGAAQIKKIDNFVQRKREIARTYNELLENIEGITTPPEMPWAKNVYWMYSILIEDSFRVTRDELAMELGKKDVETRPFFYPIHTMPPYKRNEKFLVAEELAKKGINLPSSVKLKKEEVERIVKFINETPSAKSL